MKNIKYSKLILSYFSKPNTKLKTVSLGNDDGKFPDFQYD